MEAHGTPSGVPRSHDCAIREAAWRYGKTLLPSRGTFRSLHDALQLHACAGHPSPKWHDSWWPPADALPTTHTVLTVDPAAASSSDSTFNTLHGAVLASRRMRSKDLRGEVAPLTIALRGGTHYLRQTLKLSPADSGLRIRAYPSETAVLSGGVPLDSMQWRRSSQCPGAPKHCWEATLSADQLSPSMVPSGLRLDGQRLIRARYPNADPERGGDGEHGWIRSSSTE